MPPSLKAYVPRAHIQPDEASDEFRKQWTHPGDVFSVLLILGGDVVARALAQSTGSRIGLPSFSFGWVAYSIMALVAAIGDNKLLPKPDYSCLVINGKSGYARENHSWIIGRMVRDYDMWMGENVRRKVEEILDKKKRELNLQQRPVQAGLCVSIFKPDTAKAKGFGTPVNRGLISLSLAVAALQLGVAAIPCGIVGDWGVLMITVSGILLSSATASLKQWRKERWTCRRLKKGQEKKFILTKGNGSQHVIVILGCEGFPDLEDLAGCQTDVAVATSTFTRIAIGSLAVLWILLLITASGLENNTWFLLAVGGIGIFFNIYVAGEQRDPETNGLPMEWVASFGDSKVMRTLYQVEEAYPYVGRSIRDIFFPGELRDDEKVKWDAYKQKWDDEKKARRVTAVNGQSIPPASSSV